MDDYLLRMKKLQFARTQGMEIEEVEELAEATKRSPMDLFAVGGPR